MEAVICITLGRNLKNRKYEFETKVLLVVTFEMFKQVERYLSRCAIFQSTKACVTVEQLAKAELISRSLDIRFPYFWHLADVLGLSVALLAARMAR